MSERADAQPSEPGSGPAGATPSPEGRLVRRVLAGRYRLLELVSVGGMGTVYRAARVDLAATVAVKLLGAGVADPVLRQRFMREARLLGVLSHPHTVRLFDVGEEDLGDEAGPRPFLVMEWVAGVPLSALAEPLPVERAVRIGQQIAGAIAEAHERGIVHRDIKPGNVVLSQVDGADFARVLDFGVGRLIEGTTELTAQGSFVGTPHYMAPEQVRGEDAGPAADIYSFGALLYFLVAGRPPFDGAEPFAVGYKHLHETPLPPSLAQPLPEALDSLIVRCLAKRPEERPESMVECRLALAEIGARLEGNGGGEPAARPAAGHGRSPVARVASLLAAALLGAMCSAALLAGSGESPTDAPASSPVPVPVAVPQLVPEPAPAPVPESVPGAVPAPPAEAEPAAARVPEREREPAPQRVPTTQEGTESSVDAVRERTRALLERYGGGGEGP